MIASFINWPQEEILMCKECPYKSGNNICVHKRNGDKNAKKRHCMYSNHLKCVYYCEWLDIKLKSISEGRESLEVTSQD